MYPEIFRFNPPPLNPVVIKDSLWIDDSYLRITYDATIITDTVSRVSFNDRMIVLCGYNYYLSYGKNLWLESHHTIDEDPKYLCAKGEESIIPFFLFRNLQNNLIKNMVSEPSWVTRRTIYTEPAPIFYWILSEESEKLLGYTCYKAETHFRGRDWTVWFTPDVPIDCGLWKFSGLPGLILEAFDSRGEYVFSAVGMESVNEGIYIYTSVWDYQMERETARDFEAKLYKSPLVNGFSPASTMRFINRDQGLHGNEIFNADNLTFPYNPMELE